MITGTTTSETSAQRRIATPAEWSAALAALGARIPDAAPGEGLRYRHVLMPTMVGASDLFAVREGLMASALRMRGARVTMVLCDGLPTCDARTFDNDPPDMCAGCYPKGLRNLRSLGLEVRSVSDFMGDERANALWQRALACPPDELFGYVHDGIAAGRQVFSSTLRWFRAGEAELDDPRVVAKARELLGVTLIMTEVARAAYEGLGIERALASHGHYATWGPWADVAEAMGIPHVSWYGAWRRNTVACDERGPGARDWVDVWRTIADRPLTAQQESEAAEYLATRDDNSGDWVQYFEHTDRDLRAFEARLGVAGRRFDCTLGLFANLGWDSADPDHPGVFGAMYDWVEQTARWAAGHPECLLIVKPHPGEGRFIESTPPRWSVAGVLERRLGTLPDNVRVVRADDNVSNFALFRRLDLGVVNTSSVGFEMVNAGMPVLTTGAGVHYEQVGLATAPTTREEYFATLDRACAGALPPAPDPELARRYAHAFFFRRSIPFEPIDVETWLPVGLRVADLADLAPGRLPGLDALCAGVLEGAPLALLAP